MKQKEKELNIKTIQLFTPFGIKGVFLIIRFQNLKYSVVLNNLKEGRIIYKTYGNAHTKLFFQELKSESVIQEK